MRAPTSAQHALCLLRFREQAAGNAFSVPVIGAVLLVMLQTVYSTGAPTVPRPLQNRRAADLIEAMRREIACEDALRHRMKRRSNAGGPCQLSDLMTACSEPRSARSCIMIHTPRQPSDVIPAPPAPIHSPARPPGRAGEASWGIQNQRCLQSSLVCAAVMRRDTGLYFTFLGGEGGGGGEVRGARADEGGETTRAPSSGPGPIRSPLVD